MTSSFTTIKLFTAYKDGELTVDVITLAGEDHSVSTISEHIRVTRLKGLTTGRRMIVWNGHSFYVQGE